jgi:hypothetical protein
LLATACAVLKEQGAPESGFIRRFLFVFVGLQLLLFDMVLPQPGQQHVCCP